MTKLRRFLINEATSPAKEFAQTLTMIYRDCAPFIREFIGPQKGNTALQFLYSGRDVSGNPEFIKKRVRKDRKPADMHPIIHDMLDKEFQKRFGYPARSSSLFVTGDLYIASDYGSRVYLVFPVGKYKYLWNPQVDDLYTYIGDRSGNTVNKNFDNGTGIANPIVANHVKLNKKEYDMSKKFEWLYSQKHGNNILSIDPKAKGYWAWQGKEFIKVPKGQDPIQYVTKKIGEKPEIGGFTWKPDMDYQSYFNEYWDDYMSDHIAELERQGEELAKRIIEVVVDGYSNRNLKDAVNRRSEIMIHCNEWYGIRRRSDTEEMIRKWIFQNGSKIDPIDKIIEWYYDEI